MSRRGRRRSARRGPVRRAGGGTGRCRNSRPWSGGAAAVGTAWRRLAASEDVRGTAALALLLASAILTLVSVFRDVVQLAEPGRTGAAFTAASDVWVDAGAWFGDAAGNGAGAWWPTSDRGALPEAGDAAQAQSLYRDPAYGFRLRLASSWSRSDIDRSATQDDRWPPGEYEVVFEDAAARSRLTVSVWSASVAEPLTIWAADVAAGMISVDGRWPTAASVAGQPALIVWSGGAPTEPVRYAALLAHGDRRYRVSYAAPRGTDKVGEFARTLVTFELGPDDTVDLIPPLPRPSAAERPGSHFAGS